MRTRLLASLVVAIAGCSATPGGLSTAVAPSTAGPTLAPAASPTSQPSFAAATTPPSATPAPAETASVFKSYVYPYSVALPAGWHAGGAMLKWDGVAEPGDQDPTIDKFGGPGSATMWSFAAPTKLSLDALAADRIAATLRDHGDTCPEPPEVNEPTTVGRDKAVFLAWNCGLLINHVVLIHNGLGFDMVMRDMQVHAATDPADRAALDMLLRAVTFTN